MQEIIIEAGRVERQYWRDIWRYRELFFFLAWRDLLIRYKQTVVGVAWTLIRPLVTMVVLTVVFERVAKMPSGGVPYPLLVFCGMLPWQFFAAALGESGNSLIGNSSLISKVYFPRLIIPASSVVTSLFDFIISAMFLAVLMIWYRFVPGPNLFWLPAFVVLVFGAAFGAGLWMAALTVEYRDFKHIVPFLVQFGLYASPVPYLSTNVPSQWRLLYSLNPMVGIIDGFRWALLGGKNSLYWPGLVISISGITLLIVSGITYFRRTERSFADVI